MRDEPPKPGWSWLHFCLAFVGVGFLVFFNPRVTFFHDLGPHLIETAVWASLAGIVAGALGNYNRP